MLKFLQNFWPNSIKHQLVLGVALVHAFLMSIFIFDLVQREKSFLLDQALQQAYALSETIATNSVEWTLSNNISGLTEIINSQKQYPNLDYAMIIDTQGKILTHTDNQKIGLYVKDAKSLNLIDNPEKQVLIFKSDHLIDVATQIQFNNKTVAWARIAINTNSLQQNIAVITKEGLLYTFFAILVGSIFSWLLGSSLTRRIHDLIMATKEVDLGENAVIFKNIKDDEIGNLMINFNQMEDKIHQQYKYIENLANKDALTQLYNRSGFEFRINNALMQNAIHRNYSALAFLDISKFKQLNDTYGHDKGDLLLIEIAKRIQQFINKEDIPFRFGGDEFLIIFSGISPKDAAFKIQQTVQQLLVYLNEPFQLNGLVYNTNFSIGITLFDANAVLPNVLLKQADIALFKAKEIGQNCIKLYEKSLENEIQHRMQLDEALKYCLEKDELFWLIQPQVDMTSGKTIGGEVLLRWNHLDKSIPPDIFIPISEDNRMILPISDWLIEQVFKFIRDHQIHDLVISINLSAIHFFDTNLANQLKNLLKTYEISPYQIKFELTEGIFLNDFEQTIQILNQLKTLGFQISLDDFGTGFSSLSYLKNLPVDQLKIDKSFVDGLPDNQKPVAIAKTIIDLTRNLKIDVIAEGVETVSQKNFLVENHCAFCQGYLYSKPITPEAFLKFSGALHFLD